MGQDKGNKVTEGHEKTEALRDEITELLKNIAKLNELRAGSMEFEIQCSAVTIGSLKAEEEINHMHLSAAEAIGWNEIAGALKQIAFHALELQSAAAEDPGESAEEAAEHLRRIFMHSAYIQKTVPLPGLPVPVFRFDGAGADSQEEKADGGFETRLALWDGEDLAERLKREIKMLREKLITLTIRKDYILHTEKNTLNAEFTLKIGNLQTELYEAENELREMKRRLILMQEMIEETGKADVQKVEEELDREYSGFRKAIEEAILKAIKRAIEAEEYLRREKEKERKRAERAAEEQSAGRQEKGGSCALELRGERTDGERTDDGKPADEEPVSGPDRIKKIYRRIVKAMHPDLHPDQSEEVKELFKKAIAAYDEDDLETLEQIYSMISTEAEEEGGAEARPAIELLMREKQRLLDMIRQVTEEIRSIRSQFPFTMEAVLHDPAKLEKMQRELRVKIGLTKQQTAEYRKRYEELVKKHE